jgi:sulfoxide reductase heme-binding subunit YedZ
VLAAGTALALVLLVPVLPGDARGRVSLALAEIALALLVAALSVGPVNMLRARPNPVSSDLRRDIGIWCALVGVAHSAVGLTVHLRGRMWEYFLASPRRPSPILIRIDPFGLANHSGLIAGLLLVMLALISNDLALRRLGAPRWKRLQRSAYIVAVLTVGHGIVYQVAEKRRPILVAVFAALVAVAALLQWLGWRTTRRRRATTPAAPTP